MLGSELEDLARRFEACTLPKSAWTHAAHLAVGAWHVTHHGPDQALALLRARIRRLNETHGVENSPSGGYHETITAAYVRLIAAFLARFAVDVPLANRVTELLASPLAQRDVLFRFWSREVLLGSAARSSWIEPDLHPLELARTDE